MLGKPKQKRSQDRINKILQTAESILEHESTDALTIAKISEMAGLKRTSTYKFFETPDDIKLGLIQIYIKKCNQALIANLQINSNADYAACLKDSVDIIIEFFKTNDERIVTKWDAFTLYKEQMFQKTSPASSPWIAINANNKMIARLSALRFLLNQTEYEKKKLLKPLTWSKKINNYKVNLEGVEFNNLDYDQYMILTKYTDDVE